tara:strand:+ start:2101 stop:2394 length:294 start_codon:yes stop_codon:yes gene_type:complete
MANGNKMVDDQIIEMTDAEQKEYDDRNTAWTNEAPARRMTELRRQRDALLRETDWMGNQDVTMSSAWKTYRQALRDITSQTPTDDLLSNINWPTKPS